MNPVAYMKKPYDIEQVAKQRQNMLKIRFAGVWGSAACAAAGWCVMHTPVPLSP